MAVVSFAADYCLLSRVVWVFLWFGFLWFCFFEGVFGWCFVGGVWVC